MPAHLDASSFRHYLNETFELTNTAILQGDVHSFVLLEVAEFGELAESGINGQRPFSLLFLDPEGGHLLQRIYTILHPTLGELGIFIVPISSDTSGTIYQAIFS